MTRTIMARLPAEPGWKIVRYHREGNNVILTTHHIAGWGLTHQSNENCNPVFLGLPLSLSGEDLSDHPQNVGIVSPADDWTERLKKFHDELVKSITQ